MLNPKLSDFTWAFLGDFYLTLCLGLAALAAGVSGHRAGHVTNNAWLKFLTIIGLVIHRMAEIYADDGSRFLISNVLCFMFGIYLADQFLDPIAQINAANSNNNLVSSSLYTFALILSLSVTALMYPEGQYLRFGFTYFFISLAVIMIIAILWNQQINLNYGIMAFIATLAFSIPYRTDDVIEKLKNVTWNMDDHKLSVDYIKEAKLMTLLITVLFLCIFIRLQRP